MLWTASAHYDSKGNLLHVINTIATSPGTYGWQDTWRSYAGHFGTEYWYGKVVGYHWAKRLGVDWFMGGTVAFNFNIGNPGWHEDPIQSME
jgi:hypothetical protein